MCLFFSIPLCPDDEELKVLRCWANNYLQYHLGQKGSVVPTDSDSYVMKEV